MPRGNVLPLSLWTLDGVVLLLEIFVGSTFSGWVNSSLAWDKSLILTAENLCICSISLMCLARSGVGAELTGEFLCKLNIIRVVVNLFRTGCQHDVPVRVGGMAWFLGRTFRWSCVI